MEEGRGLTRIGVSLPSNLLNKFDTIIYGRGYSSRSEGIRDAIRAYIVEYEWMERETGEEIGTITYIYDHGQRGLGDELTTVQHRYIDMIKSSTHIHLDHENCFEIIVIQGDAKKIKALAESIMSLKGVKHVKLTTTHGGI
ncbi:MAG TPA: nickel-responsive transcriptional regulator NikR [Methanomicrobia archaeon]|nr:nickel-responsive transcriptional regulator NikR [Methanomicrobia archaeon]